MITIENNGPDISSTNYWDTEHAAAGICYLSANAGVWRLLVPEAAEMALPEMRTGKGVTIEQSAHMPVRCWDVVFEDGTDQPYSVAIDQRQCDRAMKPGRCRLAVWTQRGKVLDLPCEVRP